MWTSLKFWLPTHLPINRSAYNESKCALIQMKPQLAMHQNIHWLTPNCPIYFPKFFHWLKLQVGRIQFTFNNGLFKPEIWNIPRMTCTSRPVVYCTSSHGTWVSRKWLAFSLLFHLLWWWSPPAPALAPVEKPSDWPMITQHWLQVHSVTQRSTACHFCWTMLKKTVH